MIDQISCFITWTTYGTWLPGDARGWRKLSEGEQPSQPRLEEWCREQMTGKPVILTAIQRRKVEVMCHEHSEHRRWELHAVNARTNHVHLAVTADKAPKSVRDQSKANATRVLRLEPEPLTAEQIWTKGGDVEIIDSEKALEQVVKYILEAQDRMDRGK
jgi:REP element-mobilizing transposase RayT